MTYGYIEYTYRIRCKECSKYYKKTGTEITEICPVNSSHTITSVNILQEAPKEFRDRNNKIRVQPTFRQPGTKYYFTGASDDPTDITDVGGGTIENQLLFHHEAGVDDMEQIRYFKFNNISNLTWLNEGYLMYDGCQFDYISLDFVPTLSTVEAGTNTYFNLYGGYLIIPAAGDGTINLTSDWTQPHGGLVQVLENEEGIKPPAYWDADFNTSTGEFENLTASPTGTGNFNLFSQEIIFNRFINKIPLLGTGNIRLNVNDVEIVPHGIQLKVTTNTWTCEYKSDHTWDVAVIMVFHRERSI